MAKKPKVQNRHKHPAEGVNILLLLIIQDVFRQR